MLKDVVSCQICRTGWQSISDQKYGSTVASFWVLVTFLASWGFTRCGPFDKICLSRILGDSSYSIQSWKQRIQMCENVKYCFFLGGIEIFNWFLFRHDLPKYRCSHANWKGNSMNFSMSTRKSTFCHILPEKNPIKDLHPTKKKKKRQYFWIFTHLYPLLPQLYWI